MAPGKLELEVFCEHRQVILDRQVEQLAWEEENEKKLLEYFLLDLKLRMFQM